MKMEYFGAFPALEEEMLRRGWHLCYLANANRWGTDVDSDANARFCEFISEEFGLERRFRSSVCRKRRIARAVLQGTRTPALLRRKERLRTSPARTR